MSRALAMVAVVLLAAACGGGDAADDATPADSAGAAASPSSAPTAAPDRDDDDGEVDSAAIANYRLDMDKVRGLQRAAVNLHELQQRRPELAQRMESDNLDWSEIKARIDREPEVRRAIESAGISSRDYVLGMMSLIQASMAHELSKAGMNAPAGVSEHNRRFMAEHEAEVREVMEAMPSDDDDTEP
jgi:hypothetical protein